MKNYIRLLIVILVFTGKIFAQKEATTWLFGDFVKLSFSGPGNAPVSLPGSVMAADEGCAVISDKEGNLLFYTNGETVWNRDNHVMYNGDRLKGDPSATQSAVIVPQPGYDNIYYVFTLDAQGKLDGFRYSIVDMSLDNGLGSVTTKNASIYFPSTEKLTSIINNDRSGYWVITHNWGDNRFFCHLLTKDGIGPSPVESAVGMVHNGNDMNSIGYMKFSPDGKKLALAMYNDNTVEIFDFDNKTGKLSNPVTLVSEDLLRKVYGLEFSPDGRKLYTSTSSGPSIIIQFDLSLKSAGEMLDKSVQVAYNSASLGYYALQLAPDKKIYVSKRNKPMLDVIEKPNEPGLACGFKPDGLVLDYGSCNAGLPVFIQSFFYDRVSLSDNSPICEGETLEINATQVEGGKYKWTGPDGLTSTEHYIKIENASRQAEGNYFLSVTRPDGVVDTVSTYVDIKFVKTNNPSGLDYDTICAGTESVKTITLTNEGEDPFIIDTATILTNPGIFSISTPKPLPSGLMPGESMEISVKYMSLQTGTFSDSVIILITEPCYRRIAVNLQAASNSSVFVTLPDTTGEIGDYQYSFPIRAKLSCGSSKPMKASFKIDIEYDATAYLPDPGSSNIKKNFVKDNIRYLTLEGEAGINLDSETKITEIRGKVLLPDNDSTPIFVTNITFGDPLINYTKKDGSLKSTGLCRQALNRVRTFTPVQMMVLPAPADEEASISFRGDRQGQINISFYDVRGNKLIAASVDKPGREALARIDVSSLPPGLYQVVASMDEDTMYSNLIVNR